MIEGQNTFSDVAAVVRSLEPSYPVYCLRPEVIEASARRFVSLFPGRVLYAVKCNPNPLVLKALYRGGIRHFDTASLAEIAQVAELLPDAGCYFMHPVKTRAAIEMAYKAYGIRHFVVDHENELAKVLDLTEGRGVTIMVRVHTPPAEDTLYHLSAKFGADKDEAVALLQTANNHGCASGLAFHVGSQCRTPEAYRTAMGIVGEIVTATGVQIDVLDVGGGFPAPYLDQDVPELEAYMDALRVGMKEIGLCPTVELMAEPGRALVATGCSLLTQVQLRKGDQLYINDGIYGSLSEMVAAGIRLPARLLRLEGRPSETSAEFVLNGPTCDSLDVLPGTFVLPEDAREGDWIEIDRVGAYSNASATRFNGFFAETFVEVHDAPPANTMIASAA